MRLYKEKVEEFMLGKVAPSYFKYLQKKEPNTEEICYAMCFFTDLMEHGSQQVKRNINSVLSSEFCSDVYEMCE